jgi:thiol-disulfide isomerase/thioredoxin
MSRVALSILLLLVASTTLRAQDSSDPFSQALTQGDLYQSKRKYDLALDAYHKADKLCHHSSAPCYLKIASVERKLGDFPSALEAAKRAEKVAADNKTVAVQAHLFRATLLTQMSSKPGDKKLKEAEDELRQALALDSATSMTHFNLGMVLLKQERDPEGLAEMNTYVSAPNADPATVVEARRIMASPIRARAPFAPDFSFTTRENENLSNAVLRGKVVLLDFWGTWCPPCRESVPVVRGLQKKYAGKGFQIVGVSSDDDEDVWRTFIQAQQMNWSEYIDLSGTVQQAFKIDSFPTYIVLDKDGVIRYRQSGFGEATQGDLEEAINKALKRESDPKLAAAALAEQQPASVSNSSGNSPVTSSSTAPSARSSNAPSGHSTPVSSSEKSAASTPGKATEKPDAAPSSPFAGVEGGSVSGNVYRNPALGLTLQIPTGLIPASFESLHAINDRLETSVRSTIAPQGASLDGSRHATAPKAVFYASRKGEWDGHQVNMPSIEIRALPGPTNPLDLEVFKKDTANLASAYNLKVLGDISEFTANQHHFLRADFEHGIGALRVYKSLVRTSAGDFMLDMEVNAYSLEELQHVAGFLQTVSITSQ